MKTKTKYRLGAVFVAVYALVVFTIAYPGLLFFAPSWQEKLAALRINLGLDLQGGIYLEYKMDLSSVPAEDRQKALDAALAVVERRVNAFGVGEPIVQRLTAGGEDRLAVQLPGIKDIQAAKDLIKETPFMEFREEVEPDEEAQKAIEQANSSVRSAAEEVLESAKKGEDFEKLVTEHSGDIFSLATGGDLGFVSADTHPYLKPLFEQNLPDGQVYPELIEAENGWYVVKKEAEKEESVEGSAEEAKKKLIRVRQILLPKKTIADFPQFRWKSVGLTGAQLKKADFDPGGGGAGGVSEPNVLLFFNDEGKKIFADVTTRNVGKRFAIFLDGQIISAPVIQTPIVDGVASITGNFTVAEAKALAGRLNEGALPVPITLVSQQSVDATLGERALREGLYAGALGLALTMIYMIFYYRFFGLVASLALLVYAATLVSVFKLSTLLPSGLAVTLTLSGIAGFILSVGMAVDANILIFERIKEERRRGKTMKTAVAIGFERAWPSIRDGNVSTLITCVILIGVSSGFVKGFATILFLGVIVSMFTAVVLVKYVLRVLAGERLEKLKWLAGM